METREELKRRIKARLCQRILHPSGVFRSKLLKKRAYKLSEEYTDKYLSGGIIDSILQLGDGEEKEKQFDQLCENIVNDLVRFKRYIESNSRSGENWISKMDIINLLSYKR